MALILTFVGAACFVGLALSMAPRNEAPDWSAFPALPAPPPAPYIPQQRRVHVESVVTAREPLPGHARYAEVQALPVPEPEVRVEL